MTFYASLRNTFAHYLALTVHFRVFGWHQSQILAKACPARICELFSIQTTSNAGEDLAITVATLQIAAVMYKGRSVFAQLLDFVPYKHFEYLADKSKANRWSTTLPAWSHFVFLAYAQITRREGLRDLVACLNSHRSRLYHIGIRHRVSRSTLADASERRDWQLFARLHGLTQRKINFVVRCRSNLRDRIITEFDVDEATELRADQRIKLTQPMFLKNTLISCAE